MTMNNAWSHFIIFLESNYDISKHSIDSSFWINVMSGVAFSIAGFVFVMAAFSSLLPDKYHNAYDFV